MWNDRNVATRGEGEGQMVAVAATPRAVATRERRTIAVVRSSSASGSVAEDAEARWQFSEGRSRMCACR
eukprot:8060080-Lingulodinium_polyedra.AAC.1